MDTKITNIKKVRKNPNEINRQVTEKNSEYR